MDIKFKIIEIILFMPGFLFSLSVHEAAHGYVANRFGDPTAKRMGRVTLNPIPHTDILGTIILPIMGLFGGFLFGWGKPVPVNYRNLKNFKKDALWISAAGPASNLILAVIIALLIHVYAYVGDYMVGDVFTVSHAQLFGQTLVRYLFLNLALCFFNLIPVFPLDGGKILYGILPNGIAEKVDQFTTRFGFIILIVLIVSGAIRYILMPPIIAVGTLLLWGL